MAVEDDLFARLPEPSPLSAEEKRAIIKGAHARVLEKQRARAQGYGRPWRLMWRKTFLPLGSFIMPHARTLVTASIAILACGWALTLSLGPSLIRPTPQLESSK